MTKKLHIDLKNCIGCTLCTQIAPKTFGMRNDGKSHLLAKIGDSSDKVEQAVESCPVDAIKFE
ncbi:MAG: ferredoxin [Candidatus Gracilibacteria bacterium]|jgi:ferredoxin